MAITKLTGFTGEAEVMGRMVRVEYEEGAGLMLVNLSHEEALLALDTLAMKSLVAVNPVQATTSPLAHEKPPTTTPRERPSAKSKPAPKEPDALEAAKLMPNPEVSNPVVVPSTPVEVAKPVEVAAQPEKAVESQVTPQPDNVVQLKAGDGPDLAKAKQLKDVLTILMEHHGIKTADALVAKCEELKGTVPVLSRIADIPGRVRRAMELLSA